MRALQRVPGAFGLTNNWPVFSYLKEKLVNGYKKNSAQGCVLIVFHHLLNVTSHKDFCLSPIPMWLIGKRSLVER